MEDSPRVWVYLRKSRDKVEVADPDILHKHRREMLRLATEQGYQVDAEDVREEIGSGQRIASRPVFSALLAEWERLPRNAGGIVLTTEVSRLTRGSMSERGRVQEALTRAAILHRTRSRLYDLRSPDDLFFWEIEGGFASHELAKYKGRIEAARIEMVREGRILTGTPSFGYRWDRNERRVKPHEEEFAVLQAICRDALELSTRRLSDRYGMDRSTILYILRNPAICGWPAKRHHPHQGDKRRQDNGAEWQNPSVRVGRNLWLWPDQPADYPPAITREEWERLQRVLDDRRDERSKTAATDGWCREVLRFRGNEQFTPRLGVWSCPTARYLTYEIQRPEGYAPRRLYIARETVHEAATAAILAALASPGLLAAAHLAAASMAHGAASATDETRGRLMREIGDLQRRMDTLLDREMDAEDAEDADDLASIKRLRDRCKRDLAARREALRISAQGGADLDELRQAVEWSGQDWQAMPDAIRQQLARALLAAIIVAVEPVAGRKAWRREVVAVEYRAHLAGYLCRIRTD